MILMIKYCKDRTAHVNIYGLINGISLVQEYGTALESVIKTVDHELTMSMVESDIWVI